MPAEPDVRRAVVDRIVEEQAVLLVEPGDEEQHLPAERLPAGAGEGAWLLVTLSGGDVTVVGTDPEGERSRRRDLDERVEQLRRTRRSGRFDKPGRD
ncbi:MAG TPA: DUF3006 domain-containing protein [Egibacteraceae bacterium]|nr:DUF3006 domain-containing protein [Egibacteraceae bacterium]